VARKFAVFDIDGTVMRWQFFHAIVTELIHHGDLPTKVAERIDAARSTWKIRTDRESFRTYEKVLVHAYFDALQELPVASYQAAVDNVFAEYKDQVYTYTRDLIVRLKSEDYLLFAISGSQQEIIDKFAAYYGFDAAIGARFEQKDGAFTGNFESPAEHGKQKALDTLLGSYDVTKADSYAVGDSESDITLLEAVEHPIAFNPSQGLFAEAQARGWKVVLERKNMIYELDRRDGQYVLA
jgi:HAD superfamily hydrolase (TIGR01490 family)